MKKTKNKTTKKSNKGNQMHSVHKRRVANQKRQNVAKHKKGLFVLSGELQRTQQGFGFVLVEDGDDIFVSQKNLNGAMHGDSVEVEVFGTDKGFEGVVNSIRQVNQNNIIGTMRVYQGDISVVVPDDKRYGSEFFVHASHRLGGVDNDKVVIKIFRDDNQTVFKVVEVLGQVGEVGIDVLSVLRAYDIREGFSKKVLNQTRMLPSVVLQDDISEREDFRTDLIITIDGDDTKDIDDAISVTKRGDNFVVGIHIADVAEYVVAQSSIDREAFARGTSVYFADSVVPMLPKELSNGICSLNPNCDRLTLSLIVTVDNSGNVVSSRICEGVVNTRQLTYRQVMQILNHTADSQYDGFGPMLEDCLQLSNILTTKRKSRGSIDFDLPETKIIVDSKGVTVDIVKRQREESHRIVEEFMLLANETIAKMFCQLQLPFVYRVHLKPDEKKMSALLDTVKLFGLTMQGDIDNIKPKDIADMLATVPPNVTKLVNIMALRSQMKATYEDQNLGHFGLALQNYCHFTSPIRRYPDLVIHRIIKAHLHKDKDIREYASIVKKAAKQSSTRERVAIEVEQKITDLKKAQYMQGKLGCQYTGTISGVISRGIFVELDNTVEGMLPIEHLPQDEYEVNEQLMTVTGKLHKYTVGDSIDIVVYKVTGDKVGFCSPNV